MQSCNQCGQFPWLHCAKTMVIFLGGERAACKAFIPSNCAISQSKVCQFDVSMWMIWQSSAAGGSQRLHSSKPVEVAVLLNKQNGFTLSRTLPLSIIDLFIFLPRLFFFSLITDWLKPQPTHSSLLRHLLLSWSAGSLESLPAVLRVKSRLHPGDVASSSQGHTGRCTTSQHTHIHTQRHFGLLGRSCWRNWRETAQTESGMCLCCLCAAVEGSEVHPNGWKRKEKKRSGGKCSVHECK